MLHHVKQENIAQIFFCDIKHGLGVSVSVPVTYISIHKQHITSLDSVVICRLVLNLKQLPSTQINTNGFVAETMTCGTFSNIVFSSNRFLGNIGAPLKGPDDDDDDAELENEPIVSGDEGSLDSVDPRPNDAIRA